MQYETVKTSVLEFYNMLVQYEDAVFSDVQVLYLNETVHPKDNFQAEET